MTTASREAVLYVYDLEPAEAYQKITRRRGVPIWSVAGTASITSTLLGGFVPAPIVAGQVMRRCKFLT
ncbi:hypothetical protein Pogu_2309 [Pyrobaculum oguniense TE7]|uniref:Uncharacterized protein n=1 Tax=Pyrobaculum oguniense (strain DSM 13380 / JCM 10595 / TE7) TaxID=698757 RepID=H6QBI5_PYROT|nr:hypothetical protein Pogu_2309 [Pyrobaculum oguniense TE7]